MKNVIQTLTTRLARKNGTETYMELRKLQADIAVEIRRGRARMGRRCMPGGKEEVEEEEE